MRQPSPFDDVVPKGLTVIQATLRVIVTIQCWGLAAKFLLAHQVPGWVAFLEAADHDPAVLNQYAEYAAYALVAIGGITLFRPVSLLLLLASAYFACVGASDLMVQTTPLSILKLVEHSARIVAPLALMLLDFWPPRAKFSLTRAQIAVLLVRLGIVATFAGHGIVALIHSREGGHFVDILAAVDTKVLHLDLTQTMLKSILLGIGVVDLAVALALLTSRSKPVAFYMMTWGFLAAASRVVYHGLDDYHEFMIRFAYGGLPLVLLLWWTLAVKEHEPEVIAETLPPAP